MKHIGLGTIVFATLFQAQAANANVWWPDRPGTNYNVDMDVKINGVVKNLYVHTMMNTEIDGTYFGLQTDDAGNINRIVFTPFFSAADFRDANYIKPADNAATGLVCKADNNPNEGPGYISCIQTLASGSFLKKDTWYRLRLWATGDAKSANGTALTNWTMWVIELDEKKKTVQETKVATIAVRKGWLKGARYSTVERIPPTTCKDLEQGYYGWITIGFPAYNNQTSTAGTPSGNVVDVACGKTATIDAAAKTLKIDYPPPPPPVPKTTP